MKKSVYQWIIAALLVLVVYGIGAILMNSVVLPIYTRHGEEVEVPEVVELNVDRADSLLRARGFDLVVEREQYDWTYPEGTVISQNPEAFALTKPGRRVYVTISIGEKLIVMPNLIGKSARDALFIVQSAGLNVGDENLGYEYSNYYPESVVMSQSIPPGTNLKKDTPIHITVSLGNLPNEFRVPELVGQTLPRARKVILTSGLEIGEITYQIDHDLLPNTVISQDPPAEEKTYRGALIDLVVSKLAEDTDNDGLIEESIGSDEPE